MTATSDDVGSHHRSLSDLEFPARTQHPADLRSEIGPAPLADQRARASILLNRLESFEIALEQLVSLRDAVDLRSIKINVDNDPMYLQQLGVNVEHAGLRTIMSAVLNRSPMVEIQTLSLTLNHGEPSRADRFGIVLSSMLRHVFEGFDRVRLVATLDDTSPYVSQHDRDTFVLSAMNTLRDTVVFEQDIPGKDIAFVRETTRQRSAPELVERLERSGSGALRGRLNGDLAFVPDAAFLDSIGMPASSKRFGQLVTEGIVLAGGGSLAREVALTCSFFDPANQHIAHVVVTDAVRRMQEDNVYVLLRALNITSAERYHNVFYDTDKVSAELLAHTLNRLLQKEVDAALGLLDRCDGE